MAAFSAGGRGFRMTAQLAPGRQERVATLLGWALFIAFFALFINIVTLPRTALDQREALRMWHDSLGFLVFFLVLIRLWWWFSGPTPQKPETLSAASFNFNRALLFAFLLVFAVEGLIGPFYAWSEDRDVGFFGVFLPRLMAPNENVRMATGYMHSALGFYYMMLGTLWLFYGAYQQFRYRAGWRRLFPGAAV